jgi:hypothetical protein
MSKLEKIYEAMSEQERNQFRQAMQIITEKKELQELMAKINEASLATQKNKQKKQ